MSDTTQFETSLDLGPDITPRVAITDKGYDSRSNRTAARARGITPVIPRKENSKERGRFFPKSLYKLRSRIEQTMGKLKRFKRIAALRENRSVLHSSGELRLRADADQIRPQGLNHRDPARTWAMIASGRSSLSLKKAIHSSVPSSCLWIMWGA